MPSTFIPWERSKDIRTRRHEQLVAMILNSLIRQGILEQDGLEWSLNVSDLVTGGSGGGSGFAQRGLDGNQWLTGNGAPLRSLGHTRDLYFDQIRGDVFQKREMAFGYPPSWVLLANLRGGVPGKDGKDGKDGRQGIAGPTGSPGASGSAGAMTLISSQTLGSAAATVTFSSIPGTFNHLRLIIQGRVSIVGSNDQIILRFNSDTGTNYYQEALYGSGTGATVEQGLGLTRFAFTAWPGTTVANATLIGSTEITLPFYAGTAFGKSMIGHSWFAIGTTSGLIFNHTIAGQWISTSAITQLDLAVLGGTNFVTGSSFTLYGF